tara:strand:- start:3253 stop:4263 length:1011 start_codon:yes stop_codon:yes gene_type:complete
MISRTIKVREISLLCLCAAFVITGCGDNSSKETTTVMDHKTVVAPDFSGDSAYAFISAQVDFGPRVPNTEEHDLCGEWLASELERLGADVIVQTTRIRAFDGKLLELQNIIGQYNPKARSRVMLYAHWDTRPFADKDSLRPYEPIDGANDGASGVGVLLEISRQLNLKPAEIGVDIIFFDGEDYGPPFSAPSTEASYLEWCLGSQYWAAEPHKYGYRARFGILLDMVGAKDAIFNKEGTSMHFAPHVVRKVWDRANDLGYGSRFQNNETPSTVDDNLFVSKVAGIPSANIVDYKVNVLPMGYGTFHHTHADNMDIIDKQTLQEVGETVLSVVYSEQ